MIYIQCNGFCQFAKVSAFLLAYPSDVRYSDVSVSVRMSDTRIKYEIYDLCIPHTDSIGFWEFLLDYAPIPDRFVSCDIGLNDTPDLTIEQDIFSEYIEIDLESSENTMIDHTGSQDLLLSYFTSMDATYSNIH